MNCQFDLTIYNYAFPFISESIMRMGFTSDFESLYKKNSTLYFDLANKYCRDNKFPLFRSGSIEREFTLLHILGVILAAESDAVLRKKIKTILSQKSNTKNIISAFKNEKTFEKWKSDFLKHAPLLSTALSNSVIRLTYYMVRLYFGLSFDAFSSLVSFVHFVENEDISLLHVYDDLPKAFEESINEKRIEIGNMLKRFQPMTSCAKFRTLQDKIDGIKSGPPDIPLKLAYPMRDLYCTTATLLDNSDISFSLLLEPITMTKAELQIVSLAVLRILETDKSVSQKQNLPPFDREAYLFAAGVIIQSLIKAYSDARRYSVETASKELYDEKIALSRRNEQLHTELQKTRELLRQSRTLNHQNGVSATHRDYKEFHSSVAKENQTLRAKLQEIEKEKLQWKQDLYELSRLRELAFSLESDESETPQYPEQDVLDILRTHKIFMFGGHENWQNRLKVKFPDLQTVSGTIHSVEPEIFSSADYVIFFTGHMAHTVYDKVKVYLTNRQIPFGYVAHCNFDHVIQAIISARDALKW